MIEVELQRLLLERFPRENAVCESKEFKSLKSAVPDHHAREAGRLALAHAPGGPDGASEAAQGKEPLDRDAKRGCDDRVCREGPFGSTAIVVRGVV